MESKAKNSKILSESEHVAAERNTKKTIEAEKTTKMVIFPDGDGDVFKCTINGVDFEYPKGIEIDVPIDVARLINSSVQAKRDIEALSRNNAYRNAGILG